MQAMTLAIGKNGIKFFIEHYLLPTIQQLMGQLKPPDRMIGIPDFGFRAGPFGSVFCQGITIALSNGVFDHFNPVYQGFQQGQTTDSPPVNLFTLPYQADNFLVQYNWLERYTKTVYSSYRGHNSSSTTNISDQFAYSPVIGGLTIPISIQFVFNSARNEWEMNVRPIALPSITNMQYKIPGRSILNRQDGSCLDNHANDTTQQMLADIDFATPINGLITGTLASIPGSGNLGNGIQFDFSIGDAGLAFPNNDGIQIGVKGGASYQGTDFDGPAPSPLPLPIPPADTDDHHLNLYVSGYEVDALNWAFFKAGELNTVVNAADLPDPDILKVKTYTGVEPALRPYQAFAMQAQISPNAAPVTRFQTVYELSAAVMAILQPQLPPQVYNLLTGLAGNNYVSKSDLETDLKEATIDPTYFGTIEDAAKSAGMVVTHDLNYTLEILNFQPEQPNIVFNIQRVDILSDLALGIGLNQTQVMQFAFRHANWQATFVSSTVPGFDGTGFPSNWNVAGEPQYDTLLTKLGAAGVPLPIMKGFQFDFDKAVLSLQEGYVSILANVLYQ